MIKLPVVAINDWKGEAMTTVYHSTALLYPRERGVARIVSAQLVELRESVQTDLTTARRELRRMQTDLITAEDWRNPLLSVLSQHIAAIDDLRELWKSVPS